MEKQNEKKVPAFVVEENVMPIVGFYGPCRVKDRKRNEEYDSITDDIYEKIKEVGVHLINLSHNEYQNEDEKQHVLDSLAYAEKHGIYMFVQDKGIPFDASVEDIKKRTDEYSNFASFKGVHTVDEPGNDTEWSRVINPIGRRPTIDDIAELATRLNTMEDMVGFTNLMPFREWIGVENYEQYIEEYIEKCHPRVISFDYYLYDPHYHVSHPGYFINLSIIREKSLKHGVPFWTFIQAGSYWNDGAAQLEPTPNDKPTRGQLLWNVNTALAYGSKGIEYFPLIQPFWFSWQENNTNDFGRNGLIGANGEPTQWYVYAKEANKHIRAVGEVLLKAQNKEILAVGTVAQADTGLKAKSYGVVERVETKNKSYGAIVGCFDYLGRDAFYVVNYKDGENEEVTLTFTEKQKYRVISEQISEEMPMSGEGMDCTVKLIEGGAALIVIE